MEAGDKPGCGLMHERMATQEQVLTPRPAVRDDLPGL